MALFYLQTGKITSLFCTAFLCCRSRVATFRKRPLGEVTLSTGPIPRVPTTRFQRKCILTTGPLQRPVS